MTRARAAGRGEWRQEDLRMPEGTHSYRLPTTRLSDREFAIAWLVMRGHCNKDIAGQMGITQPTLRNTMSRIFEKLAVTSRWELATWMMRQSGIYQG